MTRWLLILLILAALPAHAGMRARRSPITTGAAGSCGDAVRNGSEQCDGSDFGSATCSDYSCAAGSLSCSGACTIVSSACTNCGNLLRESFNATGYDLAGWGEQVGASTIVDEDETGQCPAVTGFTGQCLETSSTSTDDPLYYAYYALAAPQSGPIYCRAYVKILSATGISDGEGIGLIGNSVANSGFDTSTSQFVLQFNNVSGTLKFRGYCGNGGTFGETTVTSGSTYLVEWYSNKAPATDECAWRLDGGSIQTNTGAFSDAVNYINLGNGTTAAIDQSSDFVWDSVACDTRDWIGGL